MTDGVGLAGWTGFGLIAAAMAVVAMLCVLAALRRRPALQGAARAQANAQALQILAADLERDRARGLLGAADYEAARLDLERRALADIAPAAALALPRAGSRRALWAAACALPVLAVALYAWLGTPAAVDERAKLVASADGLPADDEDADLQRVGERLQAHLRREPNDARAWVLLGRLRSETGEFDRAAQAFARALETSPKVARDPAVWCEYADALAMAQGRVLAGRPRELIERALALDPHHPRALEMAGSAAYEARDFRAARDFWRRLLAQIPDDSAEHAQLSAALSQVERRARYALPGPALPGRN